MGMGDALQQRKIVDGVAIAEAALQSLTLAFQPLVQAGDLAFPEAQYSPGLARVVPLLLLQFDGDHCIYAQQLHQGANHMFACGCDDDKAITPLPMPLDPGDPFGKEAWQ